MQQFEKTILFKEDEYGSRPQKIIQLKKDCGCILFLEERNHAELKACKNHKSQKGYICKGCLVIFKTMKEVKTHRYIHAID